MKYFADCHTAEEAKTCYRKLCLEWHPDVSTRPDATRVMAEINAEWEKVWAQLKDIHTNAEGTTYTETRADHQTKETAAEFAAIIAALVRLDGITIEICGRWLWISGNTYPHKAALKAAGCAWASKKHMWYYHGSDDWTPSRGRATMADIRTKYGSQIISANATPQARLA